MRASVSNRMSYLTNKARSVTGVNSLLDVKNQTVKNLKEDFGFTPLGLNSFMLGQAIVGAENRTDHLEMLAESLAGVPPEDLAYLGQEEWVQDITKFGGREQMMQYLIKSGQVKRDIAMLIPEGSYVNNKLKFSPLEKLGFYNTIEQGATMIGFLSSITNKTLTSKGYGLFSRTYPEILSDFNLNFMNGVKSGKIKNNFYLNFLKKSGYYNIRFYSSIRTASSGAKLNAP